MEFTTIERHFDKKCSELRGREFLPAEMVELVTRVGRVQLDKLKELSGNGGGPAQFVVSPQSGKPVLERRQFPVDMQLVRELFEEFAGLLADQGSPMAEAVALLRREIDAGALDLETAAHKLLEDDLAFFHQWEERMPDAPHALRFLVQSSLTPGLANTGLRAGRAIDLEKSRNHSHCPVCGSMPLIVALREKQGFCFATCSFCRAEYRVPRLACPVCDESDASKLSYFYAEEEPGFRVQTCESCKSYMKYADFRSLDKTSVPVLDDLESLPLDILAQDKGYRRATLSAWGF